MLAHTLIYDFHYLFHAIGNKHTLIHISNSLLVRVLAESGIESSIQLFCKHFHKLLLLRKIHRYPITTILLSLSLIEIQMKLLTLKQCC